MSVDFALASNLAVSRQEIGREREPVLVIDQLLETPATLVDFAATASFAPAFGPAGGYPGLRAPAPLDYVAHVARSVTPLIGRAFALGPVKPVHAECFLSLATLQAEDLAPAQRRPHVDTVDPLQFALLHYLCDAPHGGTAFYRQQATGFERITADRLAAFEAAETADPPSGYLTGDGRGYACTYLVDARFNRLVIYRSHLLHSGHIDAPGSLSADPRSGRLTANIFLRLAQA